MHKNPPPEECRTVQTANKFHKKKEEWSELEKMHTGTSQLWSFNPKRPGLFGLPDTRGGAESAHFGKRSLTPPNFILEQQTESHMKAEVFS